MRAWPPIGSDWRIWAESLRRALSRLSLLEYKDAESRANEDGILLWDPSTGGVVVSDGGAWVPVGGGGGGATITAATLTVPPSSGYAEVVLVDAAVTATSKIIAGFAATGDEENDIESIADDMMQLFAVPEAGQVRFILTGIGPFVGPYKINYQVAA